MRIMSLLAALGIVSLVGVALADNHLGGASKVGNSAGQYTVHTTPHGHTAKATVNSKGKVSKMTVSHATHPASQLKLKKVKTGVKRHAMGPAPEQIYVGQEGSTAGGAFVCTSPEEAAQGQIWVGWAFYNPTAQQWVFIWFPIDLVENGDSGAENID
jgi:hypothetical protein